MRKLTWTEKTEIRKLQRQWEAATDEERPKIKAKMDAIRNGDSGTAATPPKKDPAPATTKKDDTPAKPAPTTDKKPAIPALVDLPHAQYCSGTEIMPMVKIEGKGWMTYETYRTMYPTRDIFDLRPDNLAVMYLNQEKYDELLEEDGDAATDAKTVMSHCAKPLPDGFEQVEEAILCGLLYAEAKFDPRIEKLGYKGNTMDDFAKDEFFDDFFDCVVYNRLHAGMTLDEARAFAKDGKLPKKAEPKKPTQPAKAKQPEGGTPPKNQSGNNSGARTAQKKPGQQVKEVKRPPKNFARMTF